MLGARELLNESFHRFGPFIIVRTLGRGGMGEVFVARTPWDENPLAAVKRLRPDVARVPTFADRFKHEAELAVRLDHPNVVGTLDVGSVEGQLYVCSELVLGKDTGVIADRLRERGQGGPAAVAIRLLLDALAGLAYVHGVREPDGRPLVLVHRDVTPGNVLVGYDGIARLADFGLAKSLLTERSKLTNHGEILGTPHYLAPEVIRGEGATPASDLYGLGAVMYRFLTGVAPHQGTTAEVLLKVLSEQPRPLSDLRPDLPPWIVAFTHRMLETDPTRRPYDASLLLKQLTHDARASGLLVPRASVARWLGTLFEVEKVDELEERDRVAALEPASIPDKPEGTVVLARPRVGSKLEAPAKVEAPDEEEEEVDSQGTELELSENDVRAYVSNEVRRRPVPMREAQLAPSRPSDVTEAAKKVELDFIKSPSFDDDSIEGMPTKAVTIYSVREEKTKIRADESNDPADTHDGPANDPTKFGPIISDSDETHLPGFLDMPPRPRVSPSQIAAPTVPSPIPPRPSRPSRVAQPGSMLSPDPSPSRSGGREPIRKPDGSVPPVMKSAVPSQNQGPVPVQRPTSPSMVGAAASNLSRPQQRVVQSNSVAKNLAVLFALLAVAIVMGIGIGVLVASLKNPGSVTIESPAAVLRDRLVRLKTEMDTRSARGEQVPPRAWELIANAGLALGDNDEARAEKHITEIERLLAKPAAPARQPSAATSTKANSI
jgi:serine/threonine protein kinase